jgi:hypothetical protein
VRCFVGKPSRTLFLTCDSPASLPGGSGCWIRMIRMSVLRQQTSHLLLICTNFGYGTVLMAACAHPQCSATQYYYYNYYYYYYYMNILWKSWTEGQNCLSTSIDWSRKLTVEYTNLGKKLSLSILLNYHSKVKCVKPKETDLLYINFDRGISSTRHAIISSWSRQWHFI